MPIAHKGTDLGHKGMVLGHKGMDLALRDMLMATVTETAPQITAERENPQPLAEQAALDASTTTWQESG